MIVPEDNVISRIKELERELGNYKGSFSVLSMRCERITTEMDVLTKRATEAESLAVKWQQKHADLYVASEETRNRANDAEAKLNALRDLLQKASWIAGVDGVPDPDDWRNKWL